MPRNYPLFGNRSKSHDDSVKLSHCSNGSNPLLKSSPVSSNCQSSSSTSDQRIKEIPPHRLQDNLHWRCSTCNSLVTTSETSAHLIGCLIDLVGPYIDSGLLVDSIDSHSDYSFQANNPMHSTVNVQAIQRHSSDRPRTKKLERPTPNIRHPVIAETTIEAEDEDTSIGNGLSANLSSCTCRKLINSGSIKSIPENGTNPIETSKCNLNNRTINKGSSNRSITGWSGSNRVYPPPPPVPPSTKSTVRPETTKKVCNSCDRSSAPERLHSHHGKSSHHHHHPHHNNNSRVNISPTKDKGTIQKTNNSKSPTVNFSQRSRIKPDINNNNNSKVIGNGDDCDLTSADNDEQPEDEEDDKDDENGPNKSNLFEDLDATESSDQSNYSSLQMKCYLCRQDFGTDDIEIHELECLEKWKHDNSVLPPNQRIPMTSTQGGGSASDHRGSFSSITGCDPVGWEHFKSQLTPCPKCGRTFFPHRLAAHEKACLGHQAGKRSKNAGQTHNSVHLVPGKDRTQLNQYPKCTKKPVPGHPRVGQFTCNKHA